jgi:orotate phosphoribosyltransferase
MERAELARQLRATSVLFGQYRLRSGEDAQFYVDKYRFESDPTLLSAITDELERLLPKSFDRLVGWLGGIPTPHTLVSRKHSLQISSPFADCVKVLVAEGNHI